MSLSSNLKKTKMEHLQLFYKDNQWMAYEVPPFVRDEGNFCQTFAHADHYHAIRKARTKALPVLNDVAITMCFGYNAYPEKVDDQDYDYRWKDKWVKTENGYKLIIS